MRWTDGFCLMTGAAVACGQGGAGAEAKQATIDRSKEEAELRATDLAWSTSASRKDIEATVACMADDGETLAPNEPAARDKAAVRTGWANLIGLRGFTIDWKPLRVQIAESGERASRVASTR
jgi:ketosteroid isomerase-like protein